jgi:hypothetical protein
MRVISCIFARIPAATGAGNGPAFRLIDGRPDPDSAAPRAKPLAPADKSARTPYNEADPGSEVDFRLLAPGGLDAPMR